MPKYDLSRSPFPSHFANFGFWGDVIAVIPKEFNSIAQIAPNGGTERTIRPQPSGVQTTSVMVARWRLVTIATGSAQPVS